MKRLQLVLNRNHYAYEILVGQGILGSSLKDLLDHFGEGKLFLVTNDRIADLYPDYLAQLLPPGRELVSWVLPDGEEYKTAESISQIYAFLAREGAHRGSLLIAFGGGVIGDMVGFAAATYMRGMPFLQIPTTLLSQVDSSIGGKTGYNADFGKNMIGAFKQPHQVIVDIDFLRTLPDNEFVAGYAELVKHAFIRDAYLFQLLNRQPVLALRDKPDAMLEVIIRSLEVKASVVEKDETESGNRALLNFGHTLAHYIETFTQYKGCLHGEAVIAGMEFAAWWSHAKGHLPLKEFERISQHLQSLGVRLELPPVSKKRFVELIAHDKKASAKGISFVALMGLGQSKLVPGVSPVSLWDDYVTFLASGGRIINQGIAEA